VPGYGTPSYGAPGYAAPADLAAWQPTDWRLVLTRGAKRLVGWFIPLGVVLYVGLIVLQTMNGFGAGKTISAAEALTKVTAANSTLTSQLSKYQTTTQSCTTAMCVEKADGQAAIAFANFGSTVQGTSMPASAAADASKLDADAALVASDLTQLSKLSPSTSASQYQSKATSLNIDKATTKFQTDYDALTSDLHKSV
jgi:hypothetical protein